MEERPKPPDGFDSWLDRLFRRVESAIGRMPPDTQSLGASELAYARTELEELRNELALFKALATCNCSDCTAKRRELTAARDRASRVIEDVFG